MYDVLFLYLPLLKLPWVFTASISVKAINIVSIWTLLHWISFMIPTIEIWCIFLYWNTINHTHFTEINKSSIIIGYVLCTSSWLKYFSIIDRLVIWHLNLVIFIRFILMLRWVCVNLIFPPKIFRKICQFKWLNTRTLSFPNLTQQLPIISLKRNIVWFIFMNNF